MSTNHPKKDWSGLKYFAVEELGEEVDTYFYVSSDRHESLQTVYCRHHAHGDGLANMTDFLHFYNYQMPEQPAFKSAHHPNLLKKFKLFFLHAKMCKGIDHQWIFYQKDRGVNLTSDHTLISFSKETTQSILEMVKERKVSLTAYLLAIINDVAKEMLLTKPHKQSVNWLLPVNFRGLNGERFDMRNCTTSLALNLKADSTDKTIHQLMKKLFIDQLPWGAWLHSNVAKVTGLPLLRMIYKKVKPSQYLGVFSNMGVWPNELVLATQTSKELPYLHVGAPSVSICPVSIACIIWHDHINLSLRLHPDYFSDSNGGELLAYKLQQSITNKHGGKEGAVIATYSAKQIKILSKYY